MSFQDRIAIILKTKLAGGTICWFKIAKWHPWHFEIFALYITIIGGFSLLWACNIVGVVAGVDCCVLVLPPLPWGGVECCVPLAPLAPLPLPITVAAGVLVLGAPLPWGAGVPLAPLPLVPLPIAACVLVLGAPVPWGAGVDCFVPLLAPLPLLLFVSPLPLPVCVSASVVLPPFCKYI